MGGDIDERRSDRQGVLECAHPSGPKVPVRFYIGIGWKTRKQLLECCPEPVTPFPLAPVGRVDDVVQGVVSEGVKRSQMFQDVKVHECSNLREAPRAGPPSAAFSALWALMD